MDLALTPSSPKLFHANRMRATAPSRTGWYRRCVQASVAVLSLVAAFGGPVSAAPAPSAEPPALTFVVARGDDVAAHDHGATTLADSSVPVLLAVYCVLIVAGSLAGGTLPSIVRLTHTRMQLLISLIGGLMLGIGIFHMLPHALVELSHDPNYGVNTVSWSVMAGIVVTFLLLRAFHFHQHGPADFGPSETAHDHDCDHEHDHDGGHHGHAHHHGGHGDDAHAHPLGWVGVFLGLAIHTLIDGLALGASVAAESAHHTGLALAGFGTFLAILLHKPLDAISITSLMMAGGWSTGWKRVVNAAFALMCPLGAALFVYGVSMSSDRTLLVGCALAFAAGVFICLALSDLLPEMEFHSHHRVPLTLMLLAGIGMAWLIGLLEPEHAHSVAPPPSAVSHPEEHHVH
ncbi:zinc transporter ZupT [Maioricimonas rarisocia]|uniref:Zinc transporter ZupT n=1 Tax=Maioricimonas rarisocia TaxID=2528026 RepID=A0A517Z6B6_9PLAN|nr:ZIP family metal transporter [Maioricimonas rarisocia]QDU38038.1 zinc transporter ZupT [Maioricimonas rarisocia]